MHLLGLYSSVQCTAVICSSAVKYVMHAWSPVEVSFTSLLVLQSEFILSNNFCVPDHPEGGRVQTSQLPSATPPVTSYHHPPLPPQPSWTACSSSRRRWRRGTAASASPTRWRRARSGTLPPAPPTASRCSSTRRSRSPLSSLSLL